MQLIFLGTGGSWPCKHRNVPSIALKMDGEILLFDCGEGTQRQFMKSTISFMQISKIFISHFHADHILGLPGLFHTMAFNDRKKMLEICGPKGLKEVIKNFIRVARFGAEFDILIRELKNGDTVQYPSYKVSVCEVDHNNLQTLAYCIEEDMRPGKFDLEKAKSLGIPAGPLYRKLQTGNKVVVNGRTITPDMVLGPPRLGRKIVYASDTRPCEAVITLARNADVLIHDGTLDSSLAQKCDEYGHSTAKQAAEIAKKANVKILFLIHISPRYEDIQCLEKEAREIFTHSYVPTDLYTYDVRYRD
jgi:ribonuclease Z